MPHFLSRNRYLRAFIAFDGLVSSGLFEAGAALRTGWRVYADFIEGFRIRGPRRIGIDLLDDAATFAFAAGLGVLIFALPPFEGTGDVWNQRRQYAVTFTDVNGEVIGKRGIRQDDAVPLSEIPPHVIKAVLATEDARFYQHFGVDVIGTLRAIIENAKDSEVKQGGSSITQQLAKNLFLSPERTMRRKINEAFLALWIEARLSKDEILKLYLDRSYLGGGNYGVEAAAQYYFGKSIRDVNLAEAAVLAGLFKAPTKYAPHANMQAALARAAVVLYRMLDVGFITQGELIEARSHPPAIANQAAFESPDYFLDFAYRETQDLIERRHLTSDYVIEVRTTIDRKAQSAAQRIVNEELDTDAPAYKATQGALVSMTPEGAIKAIVGGRSYEDSQFNRATDALRQPGSSFKPFVYLAALMNGFTPDSTVYDVPVSIGSWSPRDYSGHYSGRTTLTGAITQSLNTVPVHLMLAIGRKSIIDTARAAGLKARLLAVPSLPLGTNEVTVMDLAGAYCAFANGGHRIMPYAVATIRRPNGDILYDRAKEEPAPPLTLPADKVAELVRMMNSVILNGTGKRAFLGYTPQAGKTGTTSEYRDAWFAGFTGHLVTVVWYGNDDHSQMDRMTGGTLPAFTWKRYMDEALSETSPLPLPGLPVDGSYQRLAAASRQSLPELPLDTSLAATVATGELAPQPPPAADTAPVSALPDSNAPPLRKPDAVGQVLSKVLGFFRKLNEMGLER